MSDEHSTTDMAKLREIRKTQIDGAKVYLKEQTKLRKQLKEAWGTDELTVPELAEKTKLPTNVVFWHLMALRKFGKAKETAMKGDYPAYKLLEKK